MSMIIEMLRLHGLELEQRLPVRLNGGTLERGLLIPSSGARAWLGPYLPGVIDGYL